MTQQELQEVLTPREYAVFASIKEGKGLKEIALEQGISLNAVYIARTKVKRKIGESNFGKVLFAKNVPGVSLSQITLKDIKEIFSPLEFDFFIFFKTGKLTYRQIAKLLNQKYSSGAILLRIKNKLGEHYQMLIKPEFKIEGLEIKHRNINNDKNNLKTCSTCTNHLATAVLCQDKKIYCSKLGIIENDEFGCKFHSRYITQYITNDNRLQERDLLEEYLKDKGYLKMAYNIETNGYKPYSSIEKSQFAIASLGYQAFHNKRRSQHRNVITNAARYPVIPLTTEERKDPNIKQLLEQFNMKPIKTDFECHYDRDICDENRNNCGICDLKYSVAYYVIKDMRVYRFIVGALTGHVSFYFWEDNTLSVTFEKEVPVRSIHVRKIGQNEKELLEMDINDNLPRKEYTAGFYYGPGEYIITIMLGEKPPKNPNIRWKNENKKWTAVIEYQVTVEYENEQLAIKNQKLHF